jgi:hypothetical protein
MPLLAKEGDSKPRPLAPAGTHAARCVSVIDLGTQATPFGENHKVRIAWELPQEKAVFSEEKGEQPFLVSKEYTLSLFEKANLRKDLESWRGKSFTPEQLGGFDIFSIIGTPCLLTIIHKTTDKGKTFTNISSISALPKGMNCPPMISDPVTYSLDEGQSTTFLGLPEWLRKKIEGASEWGQEQTQQEANNGTAEPGGEEPW